MILIKRTPDGYSATFSGSDLKGMMEAFGTDTLPTPFTGRAELRDVIAAVEALNPGSVVVDGAS